ncbi:hypothetical protein ACWCP8_32445 [Streptomyces sp. NPDC002206]
MTITRAEQSAMTTWDRLPQLLEFHGGVLRWDVLQLRTLADAKRSGARVLEGIEKELAAHGIGHLPPRIPGNQDAEVLLYDLQRPGICMVMRLVQQLAEGKGDEDSDELVRMLDMMLKSGSLLEGSAAAAS